MNFEQELRRFKEFETETLTAYTVVGDLSVPTYTNEFWTSKQRGGHSLHEVSYRACFKAELPTFFIERFTKPGEVVYDPFLGRGTTALQASLEGQVAYGCDLNPLSKVLLEPRLDPPTLEQVERRLEEIDLSNPEDIREDLLVFYAPSTLSELCALREYFLNKKELDPVDKWIRMVALNRLTGHSAGFFSVYTLPPNQAVSVDSQRKINLKRKQTPEPKRVKDLILRKTRTLLKDVTHGEQQVKGHKILTQDCRNTPEIASDSVSLIVTSPPFLDVVDYAADNWLRCWFIGVDPRSVNLIPAKTLSDWEDFITSVMRELKRVLKPGGKIAFEVGEIQHGKVLLEESVVSCGVAAGLKPELIMINAQGFTKTSNIWGVNNSTKGTNTNRIVILTK